MRFAIGAEGRRGSRQGRTVVRAAGRAIVLCSVMLAASVANAQDKCGPNSRQVWEFFIPEYVCFGLAGGTLPSAAICGPGVLAGYKPVYFGAACRRHDTCYAARGARKATCDRNFRELLTATCDQTLDGRFRTLGRKACHNAASEYYHQVSAKGCEPFKAAQLRAGNRSPTCS